MLDELDRARRSDMNAQIREINRLAVAKIHSYLNFIGRNRDANTTARYLKANLPDSNPYIIRWKV